MDAVMTADASARSAPARLRHLAVRDFRNLAGVSLDVPAAGLALVGDNGHGKTNLLEAVYYLHLFRSLRGARDVELVRFGADGFHVAATSMNTRWDKVGAGFERQSGRRRILLDGVPSDRLSDALGAVPSVAFSPADVALVGGGPAVDADVREAAPQEAQGHDKRVSSPRGRQRFELAQHSPNGSRITAAGPVDQVRRQS